MKKLLAFVCVGVFFAIPLFAQTHTSVNLESQVYYILEQAELKGLCAPLSGVKPYTRGVVIAAINEILAAQDSKKLNAVEREILEQYLHKFTNLNEIIDLHKGIVHLETAIGKNDTPLSLNIGASMDLQGSMGLYDSFNEKYWGTDIWAQFYLNGDLGRNVSYELSASGGLMQAPIRKMGTGHIYYKGFGLEPWDDADTEFGKNGEYQDEPIIVYSEPLTHFPYTYKKRWDGSVFFFDSLSSFEYWPGSAAGGYNLLAEMTASFLENKLILRLGRLSHEWSSTSFGSSLAFNQMARPFLGFESEFNPVSWLSFASLTGILEYSNMAGIKDSAAQNQNAFSITMLQLRYKNYVFFDFIDSVVWPKRFELGYISPITNSFFYQNNIGDFDNMAMAFNLKGQYPGLGNIWASIFLDEVNLNSNFSLDRQMFATQAGVNVSLPFLAFSSLKLSYTKINPYNYTHNRNRNPWYGDAIMETAYTNNGVSLGYYLPPNSDEILARFQTMPVKNLTTSLQYQLIRHGADFGSSSVDGSSFRSELDPDGRDTKPELKRYFLEDGAYQWVHIVRVGAEWNLPTLPIALYGEAGAVISYFTNIAEEANVTGEPHPYSRINTSEYPESTGFIVKIGVKLFPR